MPNATHSPLTLTSAQIEFMQGRVVIYAASAGGDCQANLTQVYGTVVDTDNRITIYFDSTEAGPLLTDIRANGKLAVVFCEPGSEQALQLKAEDAVVVTAPDNAVDLLRRYHETIVEKIKPLGFSESMLRAFFATPRNHIVAVKFTPHSAFDQTPGPNAGAKFEVASC